MRQGRTTASAGNLRQLGAGIFAFSADNNGHPPATIYTTSSGTKMTWDSSIFPYIGLGPAGGTPSASGAAVLVARNDTLVSVASNVYKRSYAMVTGTLAYSSSLNAWVSGTGTGLNYPIGQYLAAPRLHSESEPDSFADRVPWCLREFSGFRHRRLCREHPGTTGEHATKHEHCREIQLPFLRRPRRLPHPIPNLYRQPVRRESRNKRHPSWRLDARPNSVDDNPPALRLPVSHGT